MYGATVVLRRCIQDDPDNFTRFFCIATDPAPRRELGRACIGFELADRPGSCVMLSPRSPTAPSTCARSSHGPIAKRRFAIGSTPRSRTPSRLTSLLSSWTAKRAYSASTDISIGRAAQLFSGIPSRT